MSLSLASELAIEAQSVTPAGATVTHLQGKARFSTDNKTWQPVKNGVVLGAGTMIQTAENSTLDLRLDGTQSKERDGDTLRLSPNSVLAIDALSMDGNGAPQDVELDLRNGELSGRIGQAIAGLRYEVKLPSGIVGVRNGTYRLTSSGVVDALSGELIVASVGQNGAALTKAVTAGHRLNVASGAITTISDSATPLPPVKPPSSTESSGQGTTSNPGQKGPGLGGSLRKF